MGKVNGALLLASSPLRSISLRNSIMLPSQHSIPWWAAVLFLLAGCRSPWVQTTVVNQQDTPIKLVEVDYPGGSFGVQTIAPHASFHYRFHILANEAVKIGFTDAANHAHNASGPELHQGEEGSLAIDIEPDSKVAWQVHLATRQ